MKRREFMKVTGIGIAGLMGLERLIRVMAGQPTPAEVEVCVVSTDIVVTCGQGFSCPNQFSCQNNGNNVTCGGVNQRGYNFSCTNYQCNSNFKCNDFQCLQGSSGDFDCRNSFECAKNEPGAQFSCDGTDLIGAQFNCHNQFTCYDGGGRQRVWCEDFWCNSGDFTCYVPFSCSSNNYDCDRGFSCLPSWSCPGPNQYSN